MAKEEGKQEEKKRIDLSDFHHVPLMIAIGSFLLLLFVLLIYGFHLLFGGSSDLSSWALSFLVAIGTCALLVYCGSLRKDSWANRRFNVWLALYMTVVFCCFSLPLLLCYAELVEKPGSRLEIESMFRQVDRLQKDLPAICRDRNQLDSLRCELARASSGRDLPVGEDGVDAITHQGYKERLFYLLPHFEVAFASSESDIDSLQEKLSHAFEEVAQVRRAYAEADANTDIAGMNASLAAAMAHLHAVVIDYHPSYSLTFLQARPVGKSPVSEASFYRFLWGAGFVFYLLLCLTLGLYLYKERERVAEQEDAEQDDSEEEEEDLAREQEDESEEEAQVFEDDGSTPNGKSSFSGEIEDFWKLI